MWVRVFTFDGGRLDVEPSRTELRKLSNYLTFLTESEVEHTITWLQSATDTISWDNSHYVDYALTAIVTDRRIRPPDQ